MTDEPFDEPQNDDAPVDETDLASEAAPESDGVPQSSNRDKRWKLARDVLVFQGKLAMDALRDLALAPVAIGAAVIGVLAKPEEPGHYFYDLMRWGRRSDKFINLFSAGQAPEERDNFPSVDDLVSGLEDVIVREHEKGGMTADAKDTIDRALDGLEGRLEKDRTRASTHLKGVAQAMKREIKRARDQVTGPAGDGGASPAGGTGDDGTPPTDEPPSPRA